MKTYIGNKQLESNRRSAVDCHLKGHNFEAHRLTTAGLHSKEKRPNSKPRKGKQNQAIRNSRLEA